MSHGYKVEMRKAEGEVDLLDKMILSRSSLKLIFMLSFATFSCVVLSANSLPQPSLDRPCLPLSSDGISRFLPSEVENADFCAPRGIAIKSVTMSDTGVWVTSQPWRTDIQGPHLPDRLAFLKVNDHPGSISMSIETAEDIYQIDIGNEEKRHE